MAGWFTGRRALWCGLFLSFGALGSEAWAVLIGRNCHVLIPSQAYRCAQPSAGDVRQLVRQYGIRTVLNLRGCCDPFAWYLEEAKATADADITLEDITLSAGRLPAPCEIRRLIDVLDHAEKPIVLHCRRGVDRTGLVSAMIRLLWTDASLSSARQCLSMRFGHFSVGRTAAMQRFFDLYQDWLVEKRLDHTPDNLRQWAVNDYRPGVGSGTLELVGHRKLKPGKPQQLTLRASNSSSKTWHLLPGTGSGVHVKYSIIDAANQTLATGNSGLFRADVKPGASIDLTLAVKKLPEGRYSLRADLMECTDCPFSQLGAESLDIELVVEHE